MELKRLVDIDPSEKIELFGLAVLLEYNLKPEQWRLYSEELMNIALSDLESHLPYLKTGSIESDRSVLLLRVCSILSNRLNALANILLDEREI